jgi:hypothetical protein
MRLGILTDLHLASTPHPPGRWHNPYDFEGLRGRLADALAVLGERRVDALAVLGDLANDGDDSSLDEAVGMLAQGPAPALVVAGNHDCELAAGALEAAVARAGGGRVRALVEPVAVAGGTAAGLALRPLGDDEFAGRRADGAPPGVLLSHFPLVSREDALHRAGLKYAGDLANMAELAEPLTAGPPLVALGGHLHARDAAARGAVLQLLFAALVEPPFECAVVEITGDPPQVVSESIPVAPSPPVPLPILRPAHGRWAYADGGWRATG